MGGLIFILLMVILISIMMPKPPSNNKIKDDILKKMTKTCPPHKWRHEEVKDPEGNTVYWYMVCDVCGPLNKQQVPERMDY